MSFSVDFYYNQSDSRYINKTLVQGQTFTGVLTENCSIMAPEVMFDNIDVLRYNYCYIPAFQRYYSVVGVESIRTGLWKVSMECDVLMSFRGDILMLNAVVNKQAGREVGDEYIDDNSLVTESMLYSRVYNFPEGFNDTGTYILITAG